jgi:hypothetical protein
LYAAKANPIVLFGGMEWIFAETVDEGIGDVITNPLQSPAF